MSHLPEGWKDAVIVAPGGSQVGPADVGGVEAPSSLEPAEKGKESKGNLEPGLLDVLRL